MRWIRSIQEWDVFSKIALINVITIVAYFIILESLAPLFLDTYSFFSSIGFSDQAHTQLNVTAILLSFVVSSTVGILIGKRFDRVSAIQHVLSSDENKILKILQETPEITQDSLKFRLGWSRPKLSAILTQMERVNLVQRKREGKTFTVFLAKR